MTVLNAQTRIGLLDIDPDMPVFRGTAACRGHDPEMWYIADEDNPRGRVALAEVRPICQGCPVRAECADWALRKRERYGVWGGLTSADRDIPNDKRTAIKRIINCAACGQPFTAHHAGRKYCSDPCKRARGKAVVA